MQAIPSMYCRRIRFGVLGPTFASDCESDKSANPASTYFHCTPLRVSSACAGAMLSELDGLLGVDAVRPALYKGAISIDSSKGSTSER